MENKKIRVIRAIRVQKKKMVRVQKKFRVRVLTASTELAGREYPTVGK